MQMKLIVGLGNPGDHYSTTRHNIGFQSVDRFAGEHGITLRQKRFNALVGNGLVSGHRVLLAKPLTFMNRSGEAVRALASYYELTPDSILALHDDMDIAFGQLRVKTQGGSAGHRGIASLIEHLGDDAFVRLRIGIGKPPPAIDPSDFVLQRYNSEELKQLPLIIASACECIMLILTRGPGAAMNAYHGSEKSVL